MPDPDPSKPRRPAAFVLTPEEATGDKAMRPRAPQALLEFSDAPDFTAPSQSAAPAQPAARGWSLGRIVAALAGAFVTTLIVAETARFIDGLFALHPWLGWFAAGLGGALAVLVFVLAGRELVALLRLRRIEALREAARLVVISDDRKAAEALVRKLIAFYAADPTSARARADLAAALKEIMDGRDLIGVAERHVMRPKDERARAAIGSAAKRVSLVTAISPRAIVDVLFVLAQSLRLVREIAALYGGRSGGLGFWRLVGRVTSHLAITGGVAVTDSVLSQVVGAGLAARLSAKLGEGVLNGVLTARVGLAAIAACRPLPFVALPEPTLAEVAGNLFSSVGGSNDRAPSAKTASREV